MKTEIENYRVCSDAVEFRKKFTTFKEALDNCERGDWMLWIAKKVDVDKRKLTLAKGRCAELVMHLMHDERSRTAVRAAIAYGHGEISESELSAAAAYAAYVADAADAADADAASARNEILKKCADICREILTDEVISKI